MYGANYYGQPQYGQGPAFYIPPILLTLSATVSCTASISDSQITNQIVSVTVTTTASVARQFQRSVSATVTTTASFVTGVARTLKLIAATTKLLNAARYTITAVVPDADAYFQADYFQNDYFQIGSFAVLGGTATTTKNITPERKTNKIDE
jgi:hypothetical protein